MSQSKIRRRKQARHDALLPTTNIRRQKRARQTSYGKIFSRVVCAVGISIAYDLLIRRESSSSESAMYIEHNFTAAGASNARIRKCGNKQSAPLDHQPPRYMSDTSNPIYFLHVGKSGGTSLDTLLMDLLNGTEKRYIGDLHYDYSFIQMQQKANHRIRGRMDEAGGFDVSGNADVVTFLRHPVARAASQFYFSKGLPWMKKSKQKALFQTFDQYLDDDNKTWTQPIADGESGADFLAGIFPTEDGYWVATDKRETAVKRHLRQNKTAAALLAAQRLESTAWFGMLEDLERSMKLLQISLGLETVPVLPKENAQKQGHPKPSEETMKKIEKYLPKDLWLHEYSQRLFEARWQYFTDVQCSYKSPDLPPLPDFGS
ncbi:hypothetical protein ACHAXT_002110 [Thalassiosira profunda]